MRVAIILAALLLPSCNAGEPKIAAADGWAREVAPGQSSAAAYVTVSNSGDGADRLIGARSPASSGAELHSSSSADGIARMRRIDGGVEVAARSTVEFRPRGNHIMLTGLKQPLRAGDTAELTLTFERSGARTIPLRILPAAATDGHAHGMDR